jgi:MFS family permease
MMPRVSTYRLVCVAGLFAIFSSTMAKSPVLPLYAAYLGAGPKGIGFAAAVSPLAGIIFSVPAGALADRYGNRRVLLLSSAIFFTAPLLYLMVSSVAGLAVVRFYHGLATAAFIPVAMAAISRMHDENRGEALGMFSSATLLGRFFAPMAGGAILGLLAMKNPAVGFKSVYAVCAAFGLITLLIVSRLPKDAGGQADGQRVGHGSARVGGVLKTLLELVSHGGILITALVEAAVLFAYGAFETFLPLYAIKLGMGAYEIGAILSSQIISVALTKPLMGKFSDKYGRTGQINAGLLLCAVSVGFISRADGFFACLGLSVLFGLSVSVVTSATSARIADLSRKEQLGSSMGMFASVMDMGHSTGPLVAGMIAAYLGLEKVFMISASVLISAFVVFGIYTLGFNKESRARRAS